ncbi:nuclear transport factor 2-like [Littorina saxatilis]|uniref:NTF2-related export protein n=1 Tax=Littorina saxatilis TaxID=31220 RepID=A0AAN9C056_9CAEN
MNPDFDTIGKTFVQAYYARFDQKASRPEVAQFYIPGQSLLTFEGEQFMGQETIHKKLNEGFPMGNIKRAVTKVDCQPTADGGVLVFVLGQLQSADSEGDKAMGFSQVFVLKTDGNTWFIQHDMFRLAIHDFAA